MDEKKLQQFEKENGMSLETAWDHVKKWTAAGKNHEAIAGAGEILKIFPDHPAKDLLAKLQQGGKSQGPSRLGQASDSLANKALGKIESLTGEKFSKDEKFEKEIEQAMQLPTTSDERLFAALSFAWILVFVPLLFRRGSTFVQFHAKQGLVVFVILYFFQAIAMRLVSLILQHTFLSFFTGFLGLIFLAFCALQAWSGKWWRIPGIWQIARKLHF